MNQGGVKTAPDPTRLDNKRERRRGAAGRAAVLRRAPSDSDCSGETASLSADSGDRAPRPPIQPPRTGKTRSSRRRGSEWEVLEGLKDGQRFEKRPDVFNGYLHKKRKWPLKGWHKRFFVVDGGILVYARSPTDVARGRLHGSVDVGLSVLSAKARRRRIDIDADEFIYHLRAKTADVFRTWLNVLKTHRLYRQHLLTFGARESVPKIHAPLEDLPPTDTSSRYIKNGEKHSPSILSLENKPGMDSKISVCLHDIDIHHSKLNNRPESPFRIMNAEKQIKTPEHNTALNKHTRPYERVEVSDDLVKVKSRQHKNRYDKSKSTCFLSYNDRKSKSSVENIGSPMRKSRKSTNIVRYMNMYKEPPLVKPFNRCMLLGKPAQKDGETTVVYDYTFNKRGIRRNDFDYNLITERLMGTIFQDTTKQDVKVFVNTIVKELYDVRKMLHVHPVKFLFKTLLDFWLQYHSGNSGQISMRNRAVHKQSINFFTKDKKSSAFSIKTESRQTQYPDTLITATTSITNVINPPEPILKEDTERQEMDEKIQNLETLLKSTIYMCEVSHQPIKDKDKYMLRQLVDNVGKHDCKNTKDNSQNSSTENIKDTLNSIISESAIPTDVAHKILNAYLNLLLEDDTQSISSTSFETDHSSSQESIKKRISKSTSMIPYKEQNERNSKHNIKTLDPGQHHLKNVIDKIVTVFSKGKKIQKRKFKKRDPLGKAKSKHTTPQFKHDDVTKHEKSAVHSKHGDTIDNSVHVNHDQNLKPDDDSKLKLLNSKLPPSIANEPNKNMWNVSKDTIFSSNAIFNKDNAFDSSLKDFDLMPYLSDSTQKSEQSYGMSFKSSKCMRYNKRSVETDEHQSLNKAAKTYPKKTVGLKNKTFKKSTPVSLKSSPIKEIPEMSLFTKLDPKQMDEHIILLKLENLMCLSKDMPVLHRHISNLYKKMTNKYSKVAKTFENIHGLSLLGQIYDEDVSVPKNDTATQWDLTTIEDLPKTQDLDKETIHAKVLADDNASINEKQILDADMQTDKKQINDITAQTDNTGLKGENICKGYALLAMLKYPIDVFKSIQRTCSLDTVSSQMKQDLSEKISPISSFKKSSSHSQIEEKAIEKGGNGKNFQVYQALVESNWASVQEGVLGKNLHAVSRVSDDLKTLYRCTSYPSLSDVLSPTSVRGPQAGFVSGTPGGRLAGWIIGRAYQNIQSGGPLESVSRELGQAQLSVQQLQRLLEALDLQQQLHHDTDVSVEGASPNVKKDRRKFGLRKKKSNSKCASVELQPPHIDPSNSHMALSALTAPPSPGGGASSAPNSAASLPIACAATRPQSLPGAESLGTAPGPASLTSLTPDHQLREDFTVLAKDLVASLKTIVATLVSERGRARAALEAAEGGGAGGAVLSALRTNLTTALHQNSELRARLSRIHDASDLHDMSAVNSDPATRQFQQSLSYSSSCVSASEFFDAEEHDLDIKPAEIIEADEAGVIELDGDSSSEAGSLSSEEGSASSDNSDTAIESCEPATLREGLSWARRTRLPAPRPTPGGPSLWNLLYKNIGKDLSQISMPVTINEPLNMLQRLCEELEYSELLDSASECQNATERMALIAAFAVSAYASSAHRAASKPFNPLLAETYECIRDDKGFRFLAEQVSHHPPISACHAESGRWCFWQEARIKTKFWGKSMEFQPTGRVHVRLLTTGDHYSWNKVTTCVHNLFGGQRWVDQYGDMHITCHGTDITCKLNFIKASSWSSSRHEVRGAVSGGGGRLRLAGRWSEALHAGEPPRARCLWRPGAMPPEHELYYGFTRFAMELNEMEPNMRELLPHTDTRLRPDQRALEEGDVDTAEQLKHQLEQAQRERRRDSMMHLPAWFRKSVEGGEEMWVFSGEYWKAREAGFPAHCAPSIW